MRHRKATFKLGKTSSHRRCMVANMLKSLIHHGRIKTTLPKAKYLKRHADKMITLAKGGGVAERRRASGLLMVRHNPLNAKEKRKARQGDTSAYNVDRTVLKKLFDELAPRYAERAGGYTRIIRTDQRTGDHADRCLIEFVS